MRNDSDVRSTASRGDDPLFVARGEPAPRLAPSILEAIGNTPLIELARIVRARRLQGRILAKLEHLNPGSSKKDRVALEIIRRARADGALRDGQTVVESTSGNTGTGLAIVCGVLGHPFVAVMSRGNSPERARQMAALGAEVVLVEQAEGSAPGQVSGQDLALVAAEAARIVDERGAFHARQFEREANVLAHELHTGPEIWQQAGGRIDVFLDCVGTGGTFTGVMRCLRRHDANVRGYVVEPAGAAVLAGKPVTNARHQIQGAGYARTDLPLFEPELVSGYVQVSDSDAVAGARELAAVEGIFAGHSSGAHLAAALRLLEGAERGATIALIICDSGLKYLSTGLFP